MIEQNDYEKILKEKGIIVFVPGGNSMWPTLKNAGQSVVIVPKTGKLSVYDVPLYRRASGKYVLHRVMEVTDDGYVMCGDSQFEYEYGITDDMIIGVMQGYYKGRKFISVTEKRSCRTALFLHRHRFIKRVAVKLHFKFGVKKQVKNER